MAEDIKRVTDKKVSVSSKKVSSEYAVVVGTVGHNAFVDRLVAKGLLDVSAIRGGWEQFVVKTIDAPVKGVKKSTCHCRMRQAWQQPTAYLHCRRP